jgi:polyisoprenoid-binding protein YceI
MKRLLLPLLLLPCLPAFCAAKLTIDPDHSAVIFHWSHHGVSNPVARLEKMDGKLVLDDADITKSSVFVKLALDGLRTGVDALDKRLKTPEFLDAAKYPDVTFKSTSIEKGPGDALKITGHLSMHGVTKPVVLAAKINKIVMNDAAKTTGAGFDASTTIRRSDFGIDKFVSTVSDELFVRITVDAYPEE